MTEQSNADDDGDYYGDAPCPRCFGDGVIIICPDDACRGAGECWHGDGEVVCPVCGGEYL